MGFHNDTLLSGMLVDQLMTTVQQTKKLNQIKMFEKINSQYF